MANDMTGLCLFRELHFQYRNKLVDFIQPNSNAQMWSFKPATIFHDFDKFFDRLARIKSILETAHEFKNLDEVVLGGARGRSTTQAVRKV